MAQRIIYLVRHGQNLSGTQSPDDLGPALTAVGRTQAELTARRLSVLPITLIHHSTLRRATETAEIIAAALPGAVLRPARLLWECVPGLPLRHPEALAHIPPERLAQGEQQAQQAFTEYFTPTPDDDRHEVVVCHGNIIRSFVCRALQVPPATWANTDVHNCGICEIAIEPDGFVMLVSHNDTGHLPYELRTYTSAPE